MLDVMPRGIDGYEVLRRHRRADERLLVLKLSANDEPEARLCGFADGAEDYVVKPLSLVVLVARLRALMRRRGAEQPEILCFDDTALDTGARRARRGPRAVERTNPGYEVPRQ